MLLEFLSCSFCILNRFIARPLVVIHKNDIYKAIVGDDIYNAMFSNFHPQVVLLCVFFCILSSRLLEFLLLVSSILIELKITAFVALVFLNYM